MIVQLEILRKEDCIIILTFLDANFWSTSTLLDRLRWNEPWWMQKIPNLTSGPSIHSIRVTWPIRTSLPLFQTSFPSFRASLFLSVRVRFLLRRVFSCSRMRSEICFESVLVQLISNVSFTQSDASGLVRACAVSITRSVFLRFLERRYLSLGFQRGRTCLKISPQSSPYNLFQPVQLRNSSWTLTSLGLVPVPLNFCSSPATRDSILHWGEPVQSPPSFTSLHRSVGIFVRSYSSDINMSQQSGRNEFPLGLIEVSSFLINFLGVELVNLSYPVTCWSWS